MGKYTIKDFKIGDSVYHLSNPSLRMVAIHINEQLNEITCRWMDKNSKPQSLEFMAQELGKQDDLRPRINVVSHIP